MSMRKRIKKKKAYLGLQVRSDDVKVEGLVDISLRLGDQAQRLLTRGEGRQGRGCRHFLW